MINIYSFRNLLFISFLLVLVSNNFTFFNDNNAKFYDLKEVKIDSIYTDKKILHLSSVERFDYYNLNHGLAQGNEYFVEYLNSSLNNQFKEFLQINNLQLTEENKKKFFSEEKKIDLKYDLNQKLWWFTYLEGQGNYNLEINLNESLNEGYVEILFDPQRFPRNYKFSYYKDNDLIKDTGYTKNSYKLSQNRFQIFENFNTDEKINKIVFTVDDNYPIADRINAIVEIKISEINSINFFKKIHKFFFSYQKNVYGYFIYSAFLFFSIILFGYPIIFLSKSKEENLFKSILFGFLVLFTFSILIYYSNIFQYLLYSYFVYSIFLVFFSKKVLLIRSDLILILYSLFFLFIFSLVTFLYAGELTGLTYLFDMAMDHEKSAPMSLPFHPFYIPYELDYHLPWATTKQLIHAFPVNSLNYQILFNNANPFDRSLFLPFLGYLISFLLGEKYFIFHCLILAITPVIFISLFSIIKKIFNTNYLVTPIFLLLTTPVFIFFNIAFSNKIFALAFILIGFYFILKFKSSEQKKDLIISGSFIFLSIVSHLYLIPYVVIFGLLILFPDISFKKIKNLLIFSILPLLGFLTFLIQQIFLSDFSLFNMLVFGLKDERALSIYNPSGLMGIETNIFEIIKNNILAKYYNLKSIFFINPHPTISMPNGYYTYTIYGCTTFSIFLFFLFGVKDIFKNNKLLILSMFLGVLLYILIWNVFIGWGILLHSTLSTYLFILIGFITLLKYVQKNKFYNLFLFLYIFEIVKYIQNYNRFDHFKNWELIKLHTPSIPYIATFIALILFLIYMNEKTNKKI